MSAAGALVFVNVILQLFCVGNNFRIVIRFLALMNISISSPSRYVHFR